MIVIVSLSLKSICLVKTDKLIRWLALGEILFIWLIFSFFISNGKMIGIYRARDDFMGKSASNTESLELNVSLVHKIQFIKIELSEYRIKIVENTFYRKLKDL